MKTPVVRYSSLHVWKVCKVCVEDGSCCHVFCGCSTQINPTQYSSHISLHIQTDLYGSATIRRQCHYKTAVPLCRQLHYVCVPVTALMVVCMMVLVMAWMAGWIVVAVVRFSCGVVCGSATAPALKKYS